MNRRDPRERDPDYCGWIARLPCVPCMVRGKYDARVQVAHLRVASAEHDKRETGKAEKPHDRWTLPLCPPHHQGDVRKVHLAQDDRGELHFWQAHGIDPFELCLALNAAYKDGLSGAAVIATYAARGRNIIGHPSA